MSDRTPGTTGEDGGVDRETIVNVVVGGLLLGLLAVNVVRWLRPAPNADLVGTRAPDFELPVAEGAQTVALSDYRGRTVLLDFWATWCPPCREQTSNIEELTASDRLDGPVTVLTVNTDEPSPGRERKVRRYLDRHDVRARTLLDNGRVAAAYNAESIPAVVAIGPEGRVRYADVGVHTADQLERILRRASSAGGG